jgi:hypothetical protein
MLKRARSDRDVRRKYFPANRGFALPADACPLSIFLVSITPIVIVRWGEEGFGTFRE